MVCAEERSLHPHHHFLFPLVVVFPFVPAGGQAPLTSLSLSLSITYHPQTQT
jgi:hypothetical protein